MSFESLDQILKTIQNQPGWEKQRHYQQLLECWQKLVTPQVANNTRINKIERQILWVETSSSAWAQNLSFQRFSLLKQLNQNLSDREVLVDIRFSSANWKDKSSVSKIYATGNQSEHPSFMDNKDLITAISTPAKTLDSAFENWGKAVEKRSQNWPICPSCETPTPKGELKRWQVCAFCATKQWQSK